LKDFDILNKYRLKKIFIKNFKILLRKYKTCQNLIKNRHRKTIFNKKKFLVKILQFWPIVKNSVFPKLFFTLSLVTLGQKYAKF
jgi:hypothetical protein